MPDKPSEEVGLWCPILILSTRRATVLSYQGHRNLTLCFTNPIWVKRALIVYNRIKHEQDPLIWNSRLPSLAPLVVLRVISERWCGQEYHELNSYGLFLSQFCLKKMEAKNLQIGGQCKSTRWSIYIDFPLQYMYHFFCPQLLNNL